MKLVSVLFSRLAWAGPVTNPKGGLYMPDTVRQMQERYGFVNSPRKLDEFDLGKGVEFTHGTFSSDALKSKQMVIGELRIYANGLTVASTTVTEDLDVLLEDLLPWASETMGITFHPDPDKGKYYTSQIEVLMEATPGMSPVEKSLVESLNNFVDGYQNNAPRYAFNSFSLASDPHESPTSLMGAFSVMRRVGKPYTSNIYFSEAPLQTSDHVALLLKYEDLLARHEQ